MRSSAAPGHIDLPGPAGPVFGYLADQDRAATLLAAGNAPDAHRKPPPLSAAGTHAGG